LKIKQCDYNKVALQYYTMLEGEKTI